MKGGWKLNRLHDTYRVQETKIPIVIGITGHRDLLEEYREDLERQVENIFINFISQYLNTPIYLLSPLAEGADRLVAKVFLKLCEENKDFEGRLVVPLPMDREEYMKDFASQISKDEFNDLISRSDDVFSLPAVEKNPLDEQKSRIYQYEQVGEYIARKSHVLIALWDGEKSQNLGGTYKVVQYKLTSQGMSRTYMGGQRGVLDSVDTGPVYHVFTPRQRGNYGNRDLTPFLLKKYPEPQENSDEADEIYNSIFNKMNIYNNDIINNKEEIDKNMKTSIKYVISDREFISLDERLKDILYRYSSADTLALYYQKKHRRHIRSMFMLGFFTVASFLIYDEIWRHYLWLMAYLLLLCVAAGLYFYNENNRQYQIRYLDYRALAEGLRVEFFWKLVGIQDEAADYYLRRQKGELEWIRNAVRMSTSTCSFMKNSNLSIEQRKKNYQLIYERWIKDQESFFSKKVTNDRDFIRMRIDEKIVKLLFTLNIVIICGIFVFAFLRTPLDIDIEIIKNMPISNRSLNLDNIVMFSSGFLLMLMSVLQGYHLKKGVAQNFRRYQKMKDFYLAASKKIFTLVANDDFEALDEVILEVGKEALGENAEWFLIQREQRPEIIM